MWNRRGQSVAEYAVLVSVVIAAIVGMQIYVKRSIQGKVKAVSDNFAGGTIAGPLQYEPYYTADGTLTTVTDNKAFTEAMTAGGKIARTKIDDKSGRTGKTTQKADLTGDNAWQ